MDRQDKIERESLIRETFGPLAHQMAEEKLQEVQAKGGNLLPSNVYIKQQEQSILQTLDKQLLFVGETLQLASEVLKKSIDLLPLAKKQEVEEEMQKAFDGLMTQIDDPFKADGTKSLQESLGLSNKTLLWMYQAGHEAFVQKNYKEAHAVFFLLTILNALVSDYWTALGMSQRHLNLESEALYAFATASILNPDKPLPRYHSADIYCALGQIEDAEIEVEELSRIAQTLHDKEWDRTVENLQAKIRLGRKAS